MTCRIIGCRDPGCEASPHQKPKPQFARLRRPVRGTCRNCRTGRHGNGCCVALVDPACPCRCRAVLGLAGPFDFADPSAPRDDDWDEEVA